MDQLNGTSLNQLPVAKKKKYISKFKQEWLKDYQFISRSCQSDEFVKCCYCGINITEAKSVKTIKRNISYWRITRTIL